MATTTTNLKLTKPAQTDYYDIAEYNHNLDLIDTAISSCIRLDEVQALLRMQSGTYNGTGSTTNRRQSFSLPPLKAVLLFRDGVPVGYAAASVPYMSGSDIRLKIDGSAFVIGGGFCNEANATYGYTVFY